MKTTMDADVRVGTWQEMFERWLESQGKSTKTAMAYLSDLRAFAIWFEQANGVDLLPELVTGVDLRAYQRWAIESRSMAPATWNRRRASLAIFVVWAQQAHLLPGYDLMQGVGGWAEQDLAPKWLTPAEWQRFSRQVELAVNGARTAAQQDRARRDAALVELMGRCGLREGECAALRVCDIEISARKGGVVIQGKGMKQRRVPLGAEARRTLEQYLACLPAGTLMLFDMTTRTMQRVIAEIGRRAGVECTPHMLRHTFAKRTLDGGAPLTVVSVLLGHARLQTTARYVKPGASDLEKAVEGL